MTNRSKMNKIKRFLFHKRFVTIFLIVLIFTSSFNFVYEVRAEQGLANSQTNQPTIQSISSQDDCVESVPFTNAPGCKTTGCGLCSVMNTPYRCECTILNENSLHYKKCVGIFDKSCAKEQRDWEKECRQKRGSCVPQSLLNGIDSNNEQDYGFEELKGVDCGKHDGISYVCVKSVDSDKCGNQGQACCYNGCKNGLSCCNYGENNQVSEMGVCREKCITNSDAIQKVTYENGIWVVWVQTLDGQVIKVEIKDGKIINPDKVSNLLTNDMQERLNTYFNKKSGTVLKYLYRLGGSVSQGGPKIKNIQVNDDSSLQFFTYDNKADVKINLISGKADTDVNLILTLVNVKDKYDTIPIYFVEKTLDSHGSANLNFPIYLPEGKEEYNLQVVAYVNGQKRAEQFWTSNTGDKGVIVLFPLNSEIKTITQRVSSKADNNQEVTEALMDYLSARAAVKKTYKTDYKSYWKDSKYREAFKKYITSIYAHAEGEGTAELGEAINNDAKLKELSVKFERALLKQEILSFTALAKEQIDVVGDAYRTSLDAISEKKGIIQIFSSLLKTVLFNIFGWFRLVFGKAFTDLKTMQDVTNEQTEVGLGYTLLSKLIKCDPNIDTDIKGICDKDNLNKIIKDCYEKNNKEPRQKDFDVYDGAIIDNLCKSDYSKNLFNAIKNDNPPEFYYQVGNFYKDTADKMCNHVFDENLRKVCTFLYNDAVDLYVYTYEMYPDSSYAPKSKDKLNEIKSLVTKQRWLAIPNSALALLVSGITLGAATASAAGFLSGFVPAAFAGPVVSTGTGGMFTLLGLISYHNEAAEAKKSSGLVVPLDEKGKEEAVKVKTAGAKMVDVGLPIILTAAATASLSFKPIREGFMNLFKGDNKISSSFDDFVIKSLGIKNTRVIGVLKTDIYEVSFKSGQRAGLKVKLSSKAMSSKVSNRIKEAKIKAQKAMRNMRVNKNLKPGDAVQKIIEKDEFIKGQFESMERTAKSKGLDVKRKWSYVKGAKETLLKKGVISKIKTELKQNGYSEAQIEKTINEYKNYIDKKYTEDWVKNTDNKVKGTKPKPKKASYNIEKFRAKSEGYSSLRRAHSPDRYPRLTTEEMKFIHYSGEDGIMEPIEINTPNGKVTIAAVTDGMGEPGYTVKVNGAIKALQLFREEAAQVDWYGLDDNARISMIKQMFSGMNNKILSTGGGVRPATFSGFIKVGDKLYNINIGDAESYILDANGNTIFYHVHPEEQYFRTKYGTFGNKHSITSDGGNFLGLSGKYGIKVTEVPLNGGEKMVLASDGLDPMWLDDVNKDTVKIVTPDQIRARASQLFGRARNANQMIYNIKHFNLWKTDDISVVATVLNRR